MPPSFGAERPAVQDPLVRYATEVGWLYLPREEALTLRRGEGGMLLYPVLDEKLLALNPGVLTPDNVREVVGRIEQARPSIEGNYEVLHWLRGLRTLHVPSEKRQLPVTVVDFARPANNSFHVTDEWEYTNGRHTNRADVMFLVNGLPVALVETKSAKKRDGIAEARKQVARYHEETPELVTPPQVFDVTHLLDFYYAPTWNLDHKSFFNWKDEEPGNFERKVKRFFTRERFLKLLSDWIVFYAKDDELQKLVLREHQTRSVEKILGRALDPEKRRGLVWHTQGSGKTLTMIKAAEVILRDPGFRAPTVLMIVDRTELESQLFQNLESYGLSAEVADSKARLRELLANDRRGLIVSTIQKFDKADANLCERRNVVVLVDEAHRTTGGDLGNYLVGALPQATLVGFTGTPIAKTEYGKGTFKVFGCDDPPKGYLDKYSMSESIEDGTTLKLRYTLAPNEMLAPRDVLEKEFLDLAAAEGLSDIEDLNEILDRALTLKAFLKSPDRVEKVAVFVADHFRKNVEPLGYKAFLVGVDREACALLKRALDRHLPAETSAVVYTSMHNDRAPLSDFKLSEVDEKKIRKAFRRPATDPKILIVTQKLLTGFDAPILYCMYLDKPMRDHVLLQTIARVNRPYEDEGGRAKPSGFVLDFVGIFGNLKKALAFDSDEVASVIENLDVLRESFKKQMEERAPAFLALCSSGRDDKAVERAVGEFADRAKREEFYAFFKQLQDLYEILSPDTFLRPYVEKMAALAALYQVLRNAYDPRSKAALFPELATKTEELVRKHAETEGLSTTLPEVTLDEKALDALKRSDPGAPGRIVNLIRCVLREVEDEKDQQPFLISIGDRAEAILEEFGDRQLSTEQAIKAVSGLLKEYLDALKERAATGLEASTFAIFWALRQEGLPEPKKLALELDAILRRFPHQAENAAQRREAKIELFKVLLAAVGKDRMKELADRLLRLPRR